MRPAFNVVTIESAGPHSQWAYQCGPFESLEVALDTASRVAPAVEGATRVYEEWSDTYVAEFDSSGRRQEVGTVTAPADVECDGLTDAEREYWDRQAQDESTADARAGR